MSDELGGMDLSALLAQAQEMSEKLTAAQAEAADEIIEGSAGGGKVRVTMTAGGEVRSVHIDPSVVDPAEVDLLEDLIVAAFHDTAAKAAAWAGEHLGGDLFGSLAGMFGGGPDDAIEAAAHEAPAELPPGHEA